ncbi:MAG: sugar phosphate nucleotidyltransferase [Simkaniaceae bacterium]
MKDINLFGRKVATIILAGGQGTRLFPLTVNRCKPAVNFAGRYRLIDIPISNALNSQFRNIFVISQYLASSLNQHVHDTYALDQFQGGCIECLTPEQTPLHRIFFKGTADAVRKNMQRLLKGNFDYFLILSGDQLYNMDLADLVRFAIKKDADLTIATLPVLKEDAMRMGLLKIDEEFNAVDFYEKPKDPKILHQYRMPKEAVRPAHLKEKPCFLASMGIYFFKRKVLEDLLQEDLREDFGMHLIPTQIKKGNTAAYVYDGYWEDIGTIRSYFNASLNLTRSQLSLDFYNENDPIHAQMTNLPAARISGTRINDSIICDGSIVEASEITHCMIGLRSHIKKGSKLKNCILLGNQFYSPPKSQEGLLPKQFSIGENCHIENAIIDEHAQIGNNVTLLNHENHQTFDSDKLYIRDGIIIVPSGAEIPDGYAI